MSAADDDESFIAMRVGGIVVDPRSQVPVVILRGRVDERLYLPIFIGGLEATAIATVLADVALPRPMTHDLLAAVVETLGARLERVTVTRIHEGTFYAELTVIDRAGDVLLIDARPSDSFALALRVDAPVFVAREVVLEAGAMSEPEDLEDGSEDDEPNAPAEADPEAETSTDADLDQGPTLVEGEDVRLEDLEPEDFGKYKM